VSDGDGADRGAAAIRRTLAKRGPALEARLREADGWSRVGRR
jgi:hypothetical protein